MRRGLARSCCGLTSRLPRASRSQLCLQASDRKAAKIPTKAGFRMESLPKEDILQQVAQKIEGKASFKDLRRVFRAGLLQTDAGRAGGQDAVSA